MDGNTRESDGNTNDDADADSDFRSYRVQFAVSPIERGKVVAPAQLPSAAGPGASHLDEIRRRKALAEARILDIKERSATRQSEAVGNVDVERGRAPSGTAQSRRVSGNRHALLRKSRGGPYGIPNEHPAVRRSSMSNVLSQRAAAASLQRSRKNLFNSGRAVADRSHMEEEHQSCFDALLNFLFPQLSALKKFYFFFVIVPMIVALWYAAAVLFPPAW